jgi:hypothetical protein
MQNDVFGMDRAVPGGVSVAVFEHGHWNVSNLLTHDGTMLSQISAAALYGAKTVLGSPWGAGVLVCS